MLFAVVLVACLISVPLAGGRLWALAEVRFRQTWAVALALAIQVAIVYAIPDGPPAALDVLQVCTYALGVWFVIANRRIPGILPLGAGGLMNIAAIAANGGLMPASPRALATAGLVPRPGQFASSVQIGHPKLLFLGDIFAIPASLPIHNVFSIGDICILLGAAYGMHRICESRLAVPRGPGDFASLRRNGPFMRVWLAQGISYLGDWMYALAVVARLTERGFGAGTLALLLTVQVGPSAIAGALGGPLIDWFHRKRLLIASDAARAVAVGSLVLVPGVPSLLHFCLVAACLGLFGSLFGPSITASLPDLVERRQLVSANALLTGTFHLAVTLGPMLGGLIVAGLGGKPAYLLNAASFVLSACLLARVTFRKPRCRIETRPLPALAEGIRYAATTPVVRGIIVTIGLVMVAASIRSPVEPLFFMRTLRESPAVLGLAAGVWGTGMVIGSLSAPALARRWPLERLLVLSVAVVGLAIVGSSRCSVLAPVLALWLVAGIGNAIATTFYQSLLQERTPEHLRGRVLAGCESVLDGALLLGAGAAGWIGATMGARGAFLISGLLFLATGGLGWLLLGRRRALVLRPAGEERKLAAEEQLDRVQPAVV